MPPRDDPRLREFCAALHAESAGRRAPWWVSIDTVARQLGIPSDRAILLADDCARKGYLLHDQSQHTKAGRRAAELPHSVSLKGDGWRVANGLQRGRKS